MTEQRTAEAPAMSRAAEKPMTQIEIDQRVFDLYDEYCHGHIDRREFLARAAVVTIDLLLEEEIRSQALRLGRIDVTGLVCKREAACGRLAVKVGDRQLDLATGLDLE